jgi:hypothetical protein
MSNVPTNLTELDEDASGRTVLTLGACALVRAHRSPAHAFAWQQHAGGRSCRAAHCGECWLVLGHGSSRVYRARGAVHPRSAGLSGEPASDPSFLMNQLSMQGTRTLVFYMVRVLEHIIAARRGESLEATLFRADFDRLNAEMATASYHFGILVADDDEAEVEEAEQRSQRTQVYSDAGDDTESDHDMDLDEEVAAAERYRLETELDTQLAPPPVVQGVVCAEIIVQDFRGRVVQGRQVAGPR